MTEQKLLPCPFCGSEAKLDREGIRSHRTESWTFIRCSIRCGVAPYVGDSCETFYYDYEQKKQVRFCSDEEADQKSYERAVSKWNTRAAPAEDAQCSEVDPQCSEQLRTQDEDVRAVVDEPVAWMNVSTGHVTTSSVVVMDWDDEKEEVQSLYRHPQRPVVMPKRRTAFSPEINQNGHLWWREEKAADFNACLDEFDRLNPQ